VNADHMTRSRLQAAFNELSERNRVIAREYALSILRAINRDWA